MFGRRKESVAVPEAGGEAPAFALPSAQGGQLRLGMRTVTGPVVVVFYRPWAEEDVEFFKSLAANEDEVNMAGGSVVGIGVAEAGAAREFARASGMKSMVLYDYAKVTSKEWGLLEKSKEHGDHSRPAVFVVDADHQVTHAWVGERPSAGEVLAAVSGITGLPKPAEEDAEEKPKKKAAKPDEAGDEKPAESAGAEEQSKKLSAEERERIKAERRAARESGKSLKTPKQGSGDGSETTNEEPSASVEDAGEESGGAKAEAGARTDSGNEETASPLEDTEADGREKKNEKRVEEE